MSNATVLQTAANRFSKVAGFAPVAVDGVIGSQTLAAVQRALDYIAVVDEGSGVSETVSDQAAAWGAAARTLSSLNTNAQPIGGFLTFVADLLKLGFVASPIVQVPSGGGMPAPIVLPVVASSGGAAAIVDAFKRLAPWQKVILGALAGLGVLFAYNRFKGRRGLSGPSTKLYLFTYRNKHNSWSDVWATDIEHARQQIKNRKNASGFFEISRVKNVPPREVE